MRSSIDNVATLGRKIIFIDTIIIVKLVGIHSTIIIVHV